ncbi:uncharacterized protein LOC133863185 [Alnus glutinosa]|uniref:uncharacterized protein LOC133863185 n=1 Tax=Alnus glutinosa TaxID=3517 RepID=UPI002D78A05D|nr:uncharacterized protein LOC133863185 [Alnus glutinosa]
MIARLEQRCNVLTAAIQRNDKGKASLVENLLQKTTSPFTEEVANICLLEKFKVPEIPFYTGLEDPVEHLDNFRAHMDLHRTPEMVACRAFPLTLSGNARDWFRSLPPNSIRHFEDLGRMFLTQFMAGRVRRKPSGSLMSLHQGPEESLKDFFMRFNQARLEAEAATDDFIYGALFQGIRKDGALMADIARKPPQNLDGFMSKAEKYINQEETLRALLGPEIARPSTSGNPKKKNPRKDERKRVPEEEARPKRDQESLRGHNWTPLNAPIMDVLLEIRRDPTYRNPRPVLANPHSRYADQYCAFHDTTGHRTEACISLRLLIERFIENRKLVRFLADQRTQQDPEPANRPHQNRFHQNQNNPRDDRVRNQERGMEPERRPDPRDAREKKPPKSRKRDAQVIGFSDDDYAGVSLPHTDALVLSLAIANHKIHRILVDTGSSADILYRSAFEQMKIDRSKVIPARHSLVGFTGEQVLPLGSIELPVTAGMYPRQRTIMVRFLIIDRPSAYNAILGRTALNEFRAVTSTPHLSMKFPTEEGVGVEKGDQRMARECYNTSLKKLPEAARLGEKKKDEEK